MAIREGRWRCPRCNSENLGRFRRCNGCGDARDDDVEFYLPEGEPEISDEKLLALANAGSERLCEFCDTANDADAELCGNCGAPLSQRRREERVLLDKAEPKPAAVKDQGTRRPRPKRSRWKLFGCLGLIALLFITVIVLKSVRRSVTLRVDAIHWVSTIEVEAATMENRSGWSDEVPIGAEVLSRNREVRSHRKVQTGTESYTDTVTERVQVGTERVKVGVKDLGNGFFEDVYEDRPVYESQSRQVHKTRPVYREEPVWDEKISYRIPVWKVIRVDKLEGREGLAHWPELELAHGQREGTRRQSATVVFKEASGKSHTKSFANVNVLKIYQPGTSHKARKDLLGDLHGL